MDPRPVAGAGVFVTGGRGFLGRVVCERLGAAGAAEVHAPSHAELELRDGAALNAALEEIRPDIVIHLAANVGGIGANQLHPGEFWRDNLLMGVNVLEASRLAGVRRLVVVGTVCAYPKFTEVPFKEDDLWAGYPEETNAPYGVAKRALAVGMDAYQREFGLAGAFLLPANLYGPHDDFDLVTSHVIPAMIRKCIEAQQAGAETVELWGTGAPSREFLYVDDCAEAIVAAAGTVDDPTPCNLGSGREVTMRDLAELIKTATGFEGTFTWNRERPDGQPRRSLDTSRAEAMFGWKASIPLEEGLARTAAWYREHHA